jgi:hypothetical protein
MLVITGIVVITLLIILIEVPPLFRKGLKRELWVFFILLFFAAGISIMHGLNIDLPSPHDWISFIYKPLSDVIYNFLK